MERRLLRTVYPMAETARLLLPLVLLLILQLAGQGSAVSPPPGSVTMDGFSYAGDGCPSGSFASSVSEDGKAMTMMFTKFIATTYSSAAERRKMCSMTIDLSYPEGFAVGLGSVTFGGYAKLDGGASGSIKAFYHVPGKTGTARLTRKIQGPLDDNFEYTNGFDLALYSQCGGKHSLSLQLEVKVNPGKQAKGGGIIRLDSLPKPLDLVWKQC
ncbi:hypothetical protein CBR_g52165 [Chara braunii]|uniref:DUF4360 domain-containing protein n=1 Tax=Chara braunii TaxID=69332 RepID=A0A388M9Q2_CHABU|nr:hypothetical protein CBR_g52165 [Chara braunii]|eukprot:GBG91280.1 hypothetical protein CBR_g52165 [Chara braunii]